MTVSNETAAPTIPAAKKMTPNCKRKENEDSVIEDPYDDMDAAPLHLHAMRIPARLQGAPSSSSSKRGSRSSSRSRSKPTSRDVSPSAGSRTPSSTTSSSHLIDSDILLDRLGLEELEPPPPHEIGVITPGLTSVNERMSEENLEDCHAFCDLVMTAKIERTGSFTSSREGSVTGGSVQGDASFLETLEEFDEEEEDDDDEVDNENTTTKPLSDVDRKKLLLQRQRKLKNKKDKETLEVMLENDESEKPL
jgi:hypothetical protein